MPSVKAGESKNQYLSRCIPYVMGEGAERKHAIAKCIGMYEQAQKTTTANHLPGQHDQKSHGRRKAKAELGALKVYDNEGVDSIKTSAVFSGVESRVIAPSKDRFAKVSSSDISASDIKKLIATQEYLELEKVESIVLADTLPEPHIYTKKGKTYISDGHHRLASAVLQGKSERVKWIGRPVINHLPGEHDQKSHGRRRRQSRGVEELDARTGTFKAYRNPSKEQAINLVKRFSDMRVLVDPTTYDFWMWRAHDSTHGMAGDALGYEVRGWDVYTEKRGGTKLWSRQWTSAENVESFFDNTLIPKLKKRGLLTNAKRSRVNPLRIDPTQTKTKRQLYARDIRSKLTKTGQDITSFLEQISSRASTADKIVYGSGYIEQRLAQMLPDPNSLRDWATKHIIAAYIQGMGKAYDTVKKAPLAPNMDKYKGAKKQFIDGAFKRSGGTIITNATPAETVRVLAARNFNELSGFTSKMAARLSNILIDGAIAGENPRDVARDIRDQLKISHTDAERIARTEIVRAYNEGQLDSLEELGIEEVGVMVEYTTSGLGTTALGNPSPCEKCAPLAGLVLRISEARGMIPRHPNCMCSWIPAGLGEDQSAQIRTHKGIRDAILKSLKAERPKTKKRTMKEVRARSTWPGKRARISRRRPKSLVEE